MPVYGRAPIIEAVIELRFTNPLSMKQVEKFHSRMKRLYPAVKNRMDIEVTVGPNGPTATRQTPTGFQMTSANGTAVMVIQMGSLAVSRLAPYAGWEALREELKTAYAALEKMVRRVPLSGASSRFINRIDVPIKSIGGQPMNEFFGIGVASPEGLFESCSAFSVTAEMSETQTGLGVRFTCASQKESPLIEHQSFLLDIDVRTKSEMPDDKDEIWDQVDQLRRAKNNVFEAALTEKIKGLIS